MELSPSARTIIVTRSPQHNAMNDQSPSARAAAAALSRPNPPPKSVPMVPPTVPITLRQNSSAITDDVRRDKRLIC